LCWGIVLGILLALPVVAQPPIVHGVDIFTTSAGTQADFTNDPLPPDFFCTGSSAFSGSIPLTGVPLTTAPAGIAGRTDTLVERLADGIFSSTGTASIPVILRALKMRGAGPFTVFCPGVGDTTWQVDVCACGPQTQTTVTAKIDPACGRCGTFDGILSVNVCLRFTSNDGRVAGPIRRTIQMAIKSMPWCYQGGLNEVSISGPFTVDTDCDGKPDLTVPGTTNFHPGWSCGTVGQDCQALFGFLTHCHENYGHPNEHPHCVNPVCGPLD
jgi:hypothetical protein